MPDERNDQQLQQNQVEPAAKTQVLALDMNNAGLVCYLPVCGINLISSIVFLFTEPRDNKFLRFHCVQSLALTMVFFVCGVVINAMQTFLFAIPFLGWLAVPFSLVWWAVVIVYIWKSIEMGLYARKGGIEKLPVIGDLAERFVPIS